ncbi:MAG: sigma-70 family RNA polymerase sigma factor [Myxococcales bacterium]
MAPPLPSDIQHLLRQLAPQVLGIAVRRFRDFAAAEDAVQEALIAAAGQWPRDGLPENPRAWLLQVTSRRMADQVRAETARRHREELVVSLVPPDEQVVLALDVAAPEEREDTLELLFLCCHPALSTASAIALTLRAVGGLTTAEIARAFMVPEATMAQRISRAKATIKSAGGAFGPPAPEQFSTRLEVVMHVLYLVFSEGYAASSGVEVVRADLSGEALRLTRTLHRLVPEVPEVVGLLALMLLTDARRAARVGPTGELVPLDQQDRTRWDHAAINEGVALISAALPRGAIGPYQVQAAIAAVHDEAPTSDATDWPQILALYAVLQGLSDNPMVNLNHAIATAMVHGTAAGFEELDALEADHRLTGHHRLDAVRAHLLERAGETLRAIPLYRRAAARTTSTAERDYLLSHAAKLCDGGNQPAGDPGSVHPGPKAGSA